MSEYTGDITIFPSPKYPLKYILAEGYTTPVVMLATIMDITVLHDLEKRDLLKPDIELLGVWAVRLGSDTERRAHRAKKAVESTCTPCVRDILDEAIDDWWRDGMDGVRLLIVLNAGDSAPIPDTENVLYIGSDISVGWMSRLVHLAYPEGKLVYRDDIPTDLTS